VGVVVVAVVGIGRLMAGLEFVFEFRFRFRFRSLLQLLLAIVALVVVSSALLVEELTAPLTASMTVMVVGVLVRMMLSLLSLVVLAAKEQDDDEYDDDDDDEDDDAVEDRSSSSLSLSLLDVGLLGLRRWLCGSTFPARSKISFTILRAVSVSPDRSLATGAPGIIGIGIGTVLLLLLALLRFLQDPLPPGGLTFSKPYGQCRHLFPQHLPRFKWVSSVKTVNPVAGSM
jgi:hypothetical protein